MRWRSCSSESLGALGSADDMTRSVVTGRPDAVKSEARNPCQIQISESESRVLATYLDGKLVYRRT